MKIYVISFLFSLCLCIMGCKANQTSSNSDKTSSSQIAALVNEMDSLKAQIKMANKNIETFDLQIEKQNTVIENLKENQNEKLEIHYWWLIGVIIVSIIVSTLISMFIIKRVRYIVEDDIERLHEAMRRNNNDELKNGNKKYAKIESIEVNMVQLQNELDRLTNELNTAKLVHSQNETTKETSKPLTPREIKPNKEGYFGMVKGKGFFNDVYNSNQDECRFKVCFNSTETEAEFEPVNLNRIRSIDGIEKAVDYIDDEVSLSDASSFYVIEKGKVNKNKDSGTWDIKSPVKIKLKK